MELLIEFLMIFGYLTGIVLLFVAPIILWLMIFRRKRQVSQQDLEHNLDRVRTKDAEMRIMTHRMNKK